MLHTFFVLLQKLWAAFSTPTSSTLANAAGILSFFGTPLLALWGLLYWFFRGKLKHEAAQIKRLEREKEVLVKEADDLQTALDSARHRKAQLEERSLDSIAAVVEKEIADGNLDLANRAITRWIATEAAAISELFSRRAEWATAHAAGSVRASGLVVASAYATAAVISSPGNLEARELLMELQSLAREELNAPSLANSIAAFDTSALELFTPNLPSAATIAVREAFRRSDRGHNRAALLILNLALTFLNQSVGPSSIATLRPRYLQARIFLALGRAQEALLVIQAVVKAQATHPDLGPNHVDTLSSRSLLAQILDSLGRSEEALPIAQQVAAAMMVLPEFGPNHVDTLSSSFLVAQLLESLGRSQDALAATLAVAEAEAKHTELGPNHQRTLSTRDLVVKIYDSLGRWEEALPIARSIADSRIALTQFGPNHRDTLISLAMLAQVLTMLDKSAEALPIAQEVVRGFTQHAELGPTHPDTLGSRSLLVQVYQSLGRNEEALPIILDVVKTQAAHTDLGRNHPTLLSVKFG